jgi:hypothetical protein
VTSTVRPNTNGSKPPPGWAADAFVYVPRSLLALGELWLTDAVVYAWCAYRAGYRKDVDAQQLAELCGAHRVSMWRALRRLRTAGWLDEDNRPVRRPEPSKQGSLRVEFAEVRAHGFAEACVLAQAKAPPPRIAQANIDGARFPKGMVAAMLGICRDTVRRVLARLESGETVRSRLAERRGLEVERRSLVRLTMGAHRGEPTRVVVRIPREQQLLRTLPPRTAPLAPQAYQAVQCDVALHEQTIALLASRRKPPPSMRGAVD